MSEITDLHQIQQRIWRLMAFEDGLFDLLLGTTFMFLAIYPVTRERLGPGLNLILFLSLLALAVVAQLAARYFVSLPRVGYAKLHRSPKMRFLVVLTFVLVLITFGLVLLTFLSPEKISTSSVTAEISTGRSYVVEIITLFVLGFLFTAMGYVLKVVRLYFYGWMIGLAYLASVYMEHNAGWVFLLPLAIAAGIIILIGCVLLRRFVRKYPVRGQGA